MATIGELKAVARPRAGKGASRAERRQGRVPGVIYGDGKEPATISLNFKELKQKVYAGHFLTTIYDIEIDGSKHRVIPRDFQLDPVRDIPIHVDFMRLGKDTTIRVSIPVHVTGADVSPGVKRGGTVNLVTHAIDVVVRPEHIPAFIEVDVSELEINHSKHLDDIKLPEGVSPVRSDLTLVTIAPPSGLADEQRDAAAAADASAASAPAAAPAAEPAKK